MLKRFDSPLFARLKEVVRKLYIVGLLVFVVWYGFFLYPIVFDHGGFGEPLVPGVDLHSAEEAKTAEEEAFARFLREQESTATTDLGYVVLNEQYVKGHFHRIGMTVESDETNVCVRCHGAVPHDKSKSIRGFLNMHAFFVACETCHIKPEEGAPAWAFRWYDKESGNVIINPPGLIATEKEMYGNYGAKIAPGRLSPNGTFSLINGEKERGFVVEYLRNKEKLTSTQHSKMKRVIHRQVAEKPVFCDGCHTEKTPYLPFAELGYPPRRIRDVRNTEVLGLIEKYTAFYLPAVFSPDVGQTGGAGNPLDGSKLSSKK